MSSCDVWKLLSFFKVYWQSLAQPSQIAKTLGSTSIRYQFNMFTSDQSLIIINPRVFAIWDDACCKGWARRLKEFRQRQNLCFTWDLCIIDIDLRVLAIWVDACCKGWARRLWNSLGTNRIWAACLVLWDMMLLLYCPPNGSAYCGPGGVSRTLMSS